MPLPATNRLPLRKERDRLTREGRSFHTRHFTIVTAPTPLSSVIPSAVGADGTRRGRSHSTQTSVIPARRVLAGLHTTNPLVPRFSILLSKKTARLAVDRNRIKRVTSALLAELLPQFLPADYLVIPKRSVLDTPHPDLLADLSSLLPKLK